MFANRSAVEQRRKTALGALGSMTVTPVFVGDGAPHLVDVLAAAGPGGLSADVAANGTTHDDSFVWLA
jgi:hypothetical protein